MDPGDTGRADLALPEPQGPSSVPEIEQLEEPLRDEPPLESAARSPPKRTWLTFLKEELEFLGVTQILISMISFSIGMIVYFMFSMSRFYEEIFSSFEVGYPFWGAIFFAVSGLLSVICERNNTTFLVRGRLGANTASSVAAGVGIIILVTNLKKSLMYFDNQCPEFKQNDSCLIGSFSTEIVATLLFLTILGFCSAVSFIIYGVGELLKKDKAPEDRLYEELNIYSPIYSELEDPRETSPSDS